MKHHSRDLPLPGQLVQPGEGWNRQVALPSVGIVLDVVHANLINILWRYPNGNLKVDSLNPVYLDLYENNPRRWQSSR